MGEVGSLSGSLSTWGSVEGDGCTIVEGEKQLIFRGLNFSHGSSEQRRNYYYNYRR